MPLSKSRIIFSLFLVGFITTIGFRAMAHPLIYHKNRKLGVGHLTIELNKLEADINFIATSLDIFGFEELPAKSNTRKRKFIDRVRKKISKYENQFVLYDKTLECKTRAYVLGFFVSEHGTEEPVVEPGLKKTSDKLPQADIHLRLHSVCKQAFKGQEIKFGITKLFPKVLKVKLHLIDGKNIKARFIKNDRGSVVP